MNVTAHWDTLSVAIYVFMALLGAICIHFSFNKKDSFSPHKRSKKLKKKDLYAILWFFSWTMFAAFRLINQNGVGGIDAWSYISYFKQCNNTNMSLDIYVWSQHLEIGWRLFTKIVRFITSNVVVYLLIYHGFLVYCYMRFVKEFKIDKLYFAPFILIFFLYLRGFSTFRTNASAGFILLMLVYLKRENLCKAILFAIISVSMQITSLLYCLFIPFYYVTKKWRLKPWFVALFVSIATVVARIAQVVLIGRLGQALGHQYYSYASHSLGQSFFDNFWKIAFGQLLLAGMLLLFDKKIKKRINMKDEASKTLRFLRLVCIFDILTIPITFVLDIWRGYEYLYIARLVMWSELIYLLLRKKDLRFKISTEIASAIVFSGWLVFRIAQTWEETRYLPYVLSLL